MSERACCGSLCYNADMCLPIYFRVSQIKLVIIGNTDVVVEVVVVRVVVVVMEGLVVVVVVVGRVDDIDIGCRVVVAVK